MTLTNLPLEVSNLIFAHLSDYESFVNDRDDDDHYEDDELEENVEENNEIRKFSDEENNYNSTVMPKLYCGKNSLLDLCLVSKHVRQIAETHLYSFFDGKRHNAGFFFRSLTQQPRYTAYVRGLRIEPIGEALEWSSLDEKMGFEWATTALCSLLHRATIASKKFPYRLTAFVELQDNRLQQEHIAQWLILNLPKLELLKISIPQEWSFEYLDYVAKFDSNLLQHLHTLHVLGPPMWQTVYGLQPLVKLKPISCLLSLPQLKDFCLDYCMDLEVGGKISNNVRRIAHWNCGATKCQIGQLLATCARLQCYELEYNGGKALDLSYLFPSVKTLECLELEVEEFTPNIFTEYPNLKELKITTDSIAMRRPGSLPSRGPRGALPAVPDIFLAKVLPPGIEKLHLGPTYRNAAELWQSKLEYLLHNELFNFNNLKLIEICWQPSERLRKTCSEASIELRASFDDGDSTLQH